MTAPLVSTIDITGWAGASSGRQRQIVWSVDDACRAIGFLQVTGHGRRGAAPDQFEAFNLGACSLPPCVAAGAASVRRGGGAMRL